VKQWLERVGEEAGFVAEDLEVDLSKMAPREADAWTIRECSHLEGYLEGDDAPFADAAYSLDLPVWANVETWDDGGPGTGFTAAGVRVELGRSLKDLAEWFRVLARLEEPFGASSSPPPASIGRIMGAACQGCGASEPFRSGLDEGDWLALLRYLESFVSSSDRLLQDPNGLGLGGSWVRSELRRFLEGAAASESTPAALTGTKRFVKDLHLFRSKRRLQTFILQLDRLLGHSGDEPAPILLLVRRLLGAVATGTGASSEIHDIIATTRAESYGPPPTPPQRSVRAILADPSVPRQDKIRLVFEKAWGAANITRLFPPSSSRAYSDADVLQAWKELSSVFPDRAIAKGLIEQAMRRATGRTKLLLGRLAQLASD
jgi:hypothetical protein